MDKFTQVKESYKASPLGILKRLLPGGRIEGNDYVAKNPNGEGSFKVDTRGYGKFINFTTGEKGGSVIDLYMLLNNCDHRTTAVELAEICGISPSASNSYTKKKLEGKEKAAYIWSKGVEGNHDYLSQKQISSRNTKVSHFRPESPTLLVPVTLSFPDNGRNLEIESLQFISCGCKDNGEKEFVKKFLKGCSTKSCFYIASPYDRSRNAIIIGEGFGDAQTLGDVTNHCVISCMGAENMRNVALRICEISPNSRIVIAANSDAAGVRAAEATRESLRESMHDVGIIYPTTGKDFGEMLIDLGSDDFKIQILKLIEEKVADGR